MAIAGALASASLPCAGRCALAGDVSSSPRCSAAPLASWRSGTEWRGNVAILQHGRRGKARRRTGIRAALTQESGTRSPKTEETEGEKENAAVRSQGAATIYGDDAIADERKVVAEEDEEEAGDGRTRPHRINFDYGFQAKFLRTGPKVPNNVVSMAVENFGREWKELRRTYIFQDLETINNSEMEGGLLGLVAAYTWRGFVLFLRGADKIFTRYLGVKEVKPLKLEVNEEQEALREQLKRLELSDSKVWERERNREAVKAPWWTLGPYYALCISLDLIFAKRPIQRFWFLETVARMPYFSYISMLHLYETLGWWRTGAEVRKVHFAEEWNEMHHLKIMESLGGDLEWGDRFFAQHAAFFYYWLTNLMFLVSPSVAYNFSELVESHAVDTYTVFADQNEELLKSLPPPPVAVAYYESDDLYMYDEFQTGRLPESRRPRMNNLHDVFLAISGDESEHVKTMVACQREQVISPHRREKMRV